MNRLAIAFFYDPHGIVDQYFTHLLDCVRPFAARTIVVANGLLTSDSERALGQSADELIVRPNVGFDVGGYKAALEKIGYENLSRYDELILFNHTFYGPLFPLEEMFSEMGGRPDDFWGITIHKALNPNPFTGRGVLPEHINSHFIAVRRPILESPSFRAYWDALPEIRSYEESVLRHESQFTQHFSQLGFRYSSYVDSSLFPSPYPTFIDVDETVAARSPILKRRLFFHDPLFHELNGIRLSRALKIIDQTSKYDADLIWSNIARTTKPRDLATNASLLRVLSDVQEQLSSTLKVGVMAHIFYVEMLDEMMRYARRVPTGSDLVITTSDEPKKKAILDALRGERHFANVEVLVVAENRGRDISALLITCRDLVLSGKYDVVCRIHSKKSPQVHGSVGAAFKYHMLENILSSEGYVQNLIKLFEQRSVGLAFPTMVHVSYPTMGQAWFSNRPLATELAASFGLNVPFDDDSPVAPYGTMFWFRPDALAPLFARRWHWSDFAAEPNHQDGGLAHAIERLFSYVAADRGYISLQVLNPEQAAFNYTKMEYKLQQLMAALPTTRWHEETVRYVRSLPRHDRFHELVAAVKRHIVRYPLLVRLLTPLVRRLVPVSIRARWN